MRLPDLVRCFVSVVEAGGFTQASKNLHLTQSAATLKIKRLEDQLQQRLFRKTVPPLEPSSEGEIVLGYAFRLLELNREMVLRLSNSEPNTTIRLGVIAHFGHHFIAEQVARLESESREILDRSLRKGAKGPALAAR
jgi:DNA-binding transcriptional LysR family regulator